MQFVSIFSIFAVASAFNELSKDLDVSAPTGARKLSHYGAAWQSWTPKWDGHLAALEISVGSPEPCQEASLTISILDGLGKTMHQEDVIVACSSDCSVIENTCLLHPSCRESTCQAWHHFELSEPVALQTGEIYQLHIETKESNPNMYISISSQASDEGMTSSLSLYAKPTTQQQFSIRTFMAEPEPSANVPTTPGNQGSSLTIVLGVIGAIMVIIVILLVVRRSRTAKHHRIGAASSLSSLGSSDIGSDTSSATSISSDSPRLAWRRLSVYDSGNLQKPDLYDVSPAHDDDDEDDGQYIDIAPTDPVQPTIRNKRYQVHPALTSEFDHEVSSQSQAWCVESNNDITSHDVLHIDVNGTSPQLISVLASHNNEDFQNSRQVAWDLPELEGTEI